MKTSLVNLFLELHQFCTGSVDWYLIACECKAKIAIQTIYEIKTLNPGSKVLVFKVLHFVTSAFQLMHNNEGDSAVC